MRRTCARWYVGPGLSTLVYTDRGRAYINGHLAILLGMSTEFRGSDTYEVSSWALRRRLAKVGLAQVKKRRLSSGDRITPWTTRDRNLR